ncbi:MAG: DUF4352 domain-containing protein [Chloroflexi bacterium]|nr:DUF4352 domain-containing protein [Chloroflexota bacterium]
MRGSFSTSSTGQAPRSAQPRRGCLLIILLGGGALLLLIAAILIFFLELSPLISEPDAEEPNPGIPVVIVKLTPPVAATPVASPLPPPPQEPCETIINSDDVQMAVSLPISITVGSESFPVVAAVSDEQGWTYPDYQGTAAWVCGTIVNYVVGLESIPENEALLVGLRPGDNLSMHLSNGTVLFFRFIERREAEANEARIFEQDRPRMTLIMEKENSTWQVATADYVSETEPVQPSTGTLAELGQPIRVGDAQLTVVEGHVERSGPDLASGTMYYLVEFSVENMGESSLDTTSFNMQLQDNLGNVYLLSPEASTVGNYGPLNSEIGVGDTMQGTAGYLVPETLAGPTLIWTFTPRPGSELRVSVSIPYEADSEPLASGHAQVSIDEDGTFISNNGNRLVIGGEIRNTGDAPITVEPSDITLTSSAGMSALSSAAPPLSWTVEPGQTQVFELQFEKPDATTVLLTVVGYSFEIRGIP